MLERKCTPNVTLRKEFNLSGQLSVPFGMLTFRQTLAWAPFYHRNKVKETPF